MKKTLGGDRLGAGKKMQAELHGYSRSTHDIGYVWRSTMASGTLVPFLSEVALPGDTFDIDLEANILTHPTIGPLFGSFKVQLDIFQAPIRLYNAMLHNNKLGIGLDMSVVKLPQLEMVANALTEAPLDMEDLDNSQVNPSALIAYLGIRGGGQVAKIHDKSIKRSFNAVPLLAYWEIVKNYYSNKQETNAYVIHTTVPTTPQININSVAYQTAFVSSGTISLWPTTDSVFMGPGIAKITITYASTPTLDQLDYFVIYKADGTPFLLKDIAFTSAVVGSTIVVSFDGANQTFIAYSTLSYQVPVERAPELVSFPLTNIDQMRDAILRHATSNPFIVNSASTMAPYNYYPYTAGSGQSATPLIYSQEGLAVKTYQSDLFNNWLRTEWIDGPTGINSITAIDTSSGSFTIDTLNLSKKVYDMLNRIAVSGGSYDDWIDAVYTHDRYVRAESPIYHGGLSRELVFQEVVSTANTAGEGATTPLGSLAGKGRMGERRKGGKVVIHVDEPSYIIGIISLTPRIDYSQGNKWDTHMLTLNDLHKPALDEIGFQELITEQMAWWDTYWDELNAVWVTKSAGKQPAWINYMTNINRTYGNFAMKNNEMFMTLNRRYEPDVSGEIADLTTYIDPTKYNFIFAETAIDAQNFWAQIGVDMTVRRKISAKVIPNL